MGRRGGLCPQGAGVLQGALQGPLKAYLKTDERFSSSSPNLYAVTVLVTRTLKSSMKCWWT